MVKEIAKIVKRDVLKGNTYSWILQCKETAKTAKPGQFVDILVEGFNLRRPISICEIFNDSIRIVFDVRGKGTAKMANLLVGDMVDMLAPLGNGFSKMLPGQKLLVVGGGIGTPPMVELSKHADFVKAIIGFKTKDAIILKDDYEKLGETIVCTDDGSMGRKGFVTDALRDILETEKFDRIAACGPKPMLKGIKEIADEFNIFCELSLEDRMACGIGACLGCQCFVKSGDKQLSARVCKGGPVFKSNEVIL